MLYISWCWGLVVVCHAACAGLGSSAISHWNRIRGTKRLLERNTCEKNRGDRNTGQGELLYHYADLTKPLLVQVCKWPRPCSVTSQGCLEAEGDPEEATNQRLSAYHFFRGGQQELSWRERHLSVSAIVQSLSCANLLLPTHAGSSSWSPPSLHLVLGPALAVLASLLLYPF